MKLTFAQIASAACGCVRVSEVGGAVRFHRLHAALGGYYAPNEGSRVRMDCPASVRLVFRSNSRTLAAGFGYGPASRLIFRAACVVDGAMHELGASDNVPSWSGGIKPLPDRSERRFELWLPSMVRTDLLFLELEDGSTFVPVKEHVLRWLAYGDSITQGMTVDNPAENHVGIIARALKADVWNMGIGGARMEAFLSSTVPDYAYDICTIAYGVNDFNSSMPVAQYLANAKALLGALVDRRPGKPVVAIAPIPFLSDKTVNANGETLDDFRAALAAAAAHLPNVTVIDGRTLVPAESGMFVDGCHPNAAGARAYAAGLLPIMQSCLKR